MKTLGQIAYEAYVKHSFEIALATGVVFQEWEELSGRAKEVWQATAEAAVGSFLEVKNDPKNDPRVIAKNYGPD
jgi:hypothetical protein